MRRTVDPATRRTLATERINDVKTDGQIKQDIIAELGWDPSVNASHIDVSVSDGAVTLSGYVATYTERFSAERAVKRVAGVKSLHVAMNVRIAGTALRRTDADIAQAVKNVLQWALYFPSDSIRVKVEDGWITLSGEVEWDYQRQTAIDAVRLLSGVTGISNSIAIECAISPTLVKSNIEAALKRRTRTDARNISVDVQGGDVTLTGSVSTWSERELAKSSARDTPGVLNVVDKMTVSH